MIVFLLLSLSISSLVGHPAPSNDLSDPLCSTLKTLGQSLQDAILQGSLCMDSELKTNCTTASLEVLKKCLDLNGAEVDPKCLEAEHMKLTEVDDKACFCGGLLKYSEMLTSVEGLLCSSHLSQGQVIQKENSVPDCKAAAAIREALEQASNDLYCNDTRSDNDCAGVTLEELISSGDDVQVECFCGRWHQLASTAAIVEATACSKEVKNRHGKSEETIAFAVNRAFLGEDQFRWLTTVRGEDEYLPPTGVSDWGEDVRDYFLAPKHGVYYFSWTVISSRSDSIRVHLIRRETGWKETKIAMSYANKGYVMVSGSSVLYLNKGDMVFLKLEDGDFHEGMRWNKESPGDNSFSGFQI